VSDETQKGVVDLGKALGKTTVRFKPREKKDPKTKKINTVLIDGGYFLFYRFYATKLWYSKAHSDDPIEDGKWIESEIFMNMFRKQIPLSIITISKTFSSSVSDVIFAVDSPRSTLWRKTELFKEYKEGRKEVKGIGPIIKAGLECVKSMALRPKMIKAEMAEADDVIAIVCKEMARIRPDRKMVIITSDKDMDQLTKYDQVSINRLGKGFPPAKKGEHDPQTMLRLKILFGDKSDNIKPVFSKSEIKKIGGNEKIVEMAQDEKSLESFMQERHDASERYNANKRLVDMDMIPDEIRESILVSFRLNVT